MAKAKESTREFFDSIIKEYRKNNEDILDDGMSIMIMIQLAKYV